MAAGDLLFYTSSGSLFDRIISSWTGSRFIHVAIDYDGHQKVEMLGQGCVIDAIVTNTVAARWSMPTTLAVSDACLDALSWLHSQIGSPYGWNDVVEALDKSHRFLWVQTGHSDCSHLAADFLRRTGYDTSGLPDDLSQVTPGSLATFLKVK